MVVPGFFLGLIEKGSHHRLQRALGTVRAQGINNLSSTTPSLRKDGISVITLQASGAVRLSAFAHCQRLLSASRYAKGAQYLVA